MTTGEAEKLLSAKGYLKSRYQAMIGAKIPGRVERMLVEEGSKVKKGQVLAVLEHNELKAILASRKAMAAQTEAAAPRGPDRPQGEGARGAPRPPALQPEDRLDRGVPEGRRRPRHGRGQGRRASRPRSS